MVYSGKCVNINCNGKDAVGYCRECHKPLCVRHYNKINEKYEFECSACRTVRLKCLTCHR